MATYKEYNTVRQSGFAEPCYLGNDYPIYPVPDTILCSSAPGMIEKAKSIFEPCHTVSKSSTYSNVCGNSLSESNLESLISLTTSSADSYVKSWDGNNKITVTFTSPYQTTMPKFKVGDTIEYNSCEDRRSAPCSSWTLEDGEEFYVTAISADRTMYTLNCVYCTGTERNGILALVSNIDPHCLLLSSTPSSQLNFMGIIQIIRNTFTWVFGSKEEKLLRKTGLKDDNGNFTDEARQAYLETLMQADTQKKTGSILLDMAKTIKEEQDEEKKNSKACC